MPQRQDAEEHPHWMRLAMRLAIWVIPSLALPLILGIFIDILLRSGPWGLLVGLFTGMLIATFVVVRTIQVHFRTLAPEAEDAKENS